MYFLIMKNSEDSEGHCSLYNDSAVQFYLTVHLRDIITQDNGSKVFKNKIKTTKTNFKPNQKHAIEASMALGQSCVIKELFSSQHRQRS